MVREIYQRLKEYSVYQVDRPRVYLSSKSFNGFEEFDQIENSIEELFDQSCTLVPSVQSKLEGGDNS